MMKLKECKECNIKYPLHEIIENHRICKNCHYIIKNDKLYNDEPENRR